MFPDGSPYALRRDLVFPAVHVFPQVEAPTDDVTRIVETAVGLVWNRIPDETRERLSAPLPLVFVVPEIPSGLPDKFMYGRAYPAGWLLKGRPQPEIPFISLGWRYAGRLPFELLCQVFAHEVAHLALATDPETAAFWTDEQRTDALAQMGLQL